MGEEDRIIVCRPSHTLMIIVLLIIGSIVVFFGLLMWSAFAILLSTIGWDIYTGIIVGFTIVYLSLLLSPVNIPLVKVERRILIPSVDFVVVFGIPYPIPRLKESIRRMIIAVNLGGAVIPVIISIYLIHKMLLFNIPLITILAGITIVSLITFAVSRVVPGVGIVTPALIPPLTSAVVSILLSGGGLPSIPLSYVSGCLGTLIGADVLRFAKEWRKLNAPMVSIGGAGTFDGIYLTGILSVILVLFIL